jgi:hypothetical protein
MPLVFALLGALLLLPGSALAQSSSQSGMTPTQRCDQRHQDCIKSCFGADMQTCSQRCAAARAQCIQNPSIATQPPRR